MKKLISLFLVLALSAGILPTACAADEPEFFTREYPLYLFDTETKYTTELPLFFFEGAEDLPWIDLEEAADILNALMTELGGEQSFHLSYSKEGQVITLERENGYTMDVDFEHKAIFFDDYNAFLQHPASQSLLDMLSLSGFNEAGEPELFQRDTRASYDRYGEMKVLDLEDYGIDMLLKGDRGYLPLQVINDFVYAPYTSNYILFNGEVMIFCNDEDMWDANNDCFTPLGELYFSAKPAARSQALADFGYNELIMMLDSQYGLAAKHSIPSFGKMFWEIGFDEPLDSTNPADADTALCNFINYYLDDLHSAFELPSWMTGYETSLQGTEGPSSRMDSKQTKLYGELRRQGMGENISPYEEVGNTAYVTFDSFRDDFKGSYYYEAAKEGVRLDDTIGLISYASAQINREDSPIENVVIDLSNNIGGSVNAAVFVISWILGEGELSVEDANTGAQSTLVYRADVNLDHEFDERDTLQGKHVYCLISPVSFSCGNLVPAVWKYTQAATLIGRKSGGGACKVQKMSTAWGTMLQISGNARLAFRKNGSFYDIDEGVDPDIYISRLETLYDREKLTQFINDLP